MISNTLLPFAGNFLTFALSEVVVPVFCGGSQTGVLAALLDIDSPVLNNFSPELVEALKNVCAAVGQALF